MPNVLIAIPTFRRPGGLARLLHAIGRIETGAHIRVIVADNDIERHEGMIVAERFAAHSWRWPIETVAVPERGIAQARNALVAHALASEETDYIAMLDDDEWPEAGWLEAFLAVARQTQADALHGAVIPFFERMPGPWVKSCRGLAALRHRSGPVAMIHGTANVLLRCDTLRTIAPPWFDPAFALSGGEDKDFFTRLVRRGARFAWADEAVVHAYVPVSRSNPRWALKRNFRIGNSDMRVFLKYEHATLARAGEAAKIAAALAISPSLALLLAPFPAKRMMPLCKFARASGKLAAAFGVQYDEYAVTHGE